MKKTVLAITIFASTASMTYAATDIQNNEQTDSPNLISAKQNSADQNSRRRMSYVEIQGGFGSQKATGLYTTSENRASSDKSEKDFKSSSFSIIWGNDLYQGPSQTPARIETALTIRSSDTLAYSSRTDMNNTVHTAGMKVGLDSLMVNAYFDFYNNSPITPYIMGGAGLAIPFSITDNITSASSDNSFYPITTSAYAAVWSVGLGFNFQVNPSFAIDVGAKYSQVGSTSKTFSYEKLKANPTYSIDGINAVEGIIGLRLNY